MGTVSGSCSLFSIGSLSSFYSRGSSPLEILKELPSMHELIRNACSMIYSISRGNMVTPCNTPSSQVESLVPLEPTAYIPKEMYCIPENEEEYNRPLSPFRVKFFEQDNVSLSSSVIDFDRVYYGNISWTPEPLMPKTFGYDVYGNEIVEEAPPRLSYAFASARETKQMIFEKLMKYRTYKEQKAKVMNDKPEDTKSLAVAPSNSSPRGETLEEYIKNIKENQLQWTNEQKIIVLPRIRRKIEEGSCPNFSVIEKNLPTLLRLTWKGKLMKLKKYLADKTKHVKINRQDDQGRIALHYAASWSCKKTIQVLLKIPGIKLDIKDAHDMTALFKAVQINSLDCVKLLIDAGANPNIICRDGRTVVDYAIQELGDDHIDLIEYLLNNGVGKKDEMSDGRVLTYLHKACLAKSHISVDEIIELLIRHGENINATEGKGRTPLMIAVIAQRPDILRCLLRHFADVKVYDDRLKNAFSYAKQGTICYDLLSTYFAGRQFAQKLRHSRPSGSCSSSTNKEMARKIEGKTTGNEKKCDGGDIPPLFLASKYKQ